MVASKLIQELAAARAAGLKFLPIGGHAVALTATGATPMMWI
jgi:hypothetical protein